MFNMVDEDGSGILDREEMTAMIKKLGILVKEVEIDTLMEKLDADGSGGIEVDEFDRWLFNTSDVWLERRRRAPDDEFSDKRLLERELLRFDPGVQTMLQRMWDLVDMDDSGAVDREEYVRLNINLQQAVMDDFDPSEGRKIALREWEFDSQGCETMDKRLFFWSFFQLADAWRDGPDITGEAYVGFIDFLTDRCTELEEVEEVLPGGQIRRKSVVAWKWQSDPEWAKKIEPMRVKEKEARDAAKLIDSLAPKVGKGVHLDGYEAGGEAIEAIEKKASAAEEAKKVAADGAKSPGKPEKKAAKKDDSKRKTVVDKKGKKDSKSKKAMKESKTKLDAAAAFGKASKAPRPRPRPRPRPAAADGAAGGAAPRRRRRRRRRRGPGPRLDGRRRARRRGRASPVPGDDARPGSVAEGSFRPMDDAASLASAKSAAERSASGVVVDDADDAAALVDDDAARRPREPRGSLGSLGGAGDGAELDDGGDASPGGAGDPASPLGGGEPDGARRRGPAVFDDASEASAGGGPGSAAAKSRGSLGSLEGGDDGGDDAERDAARGGAERGEPRGVRDRLPAADEVRADEGAPAPVLHHDARRESAVERGLFPPSDFTRVGAGLTWSSPAGGALGPYGDPAGARGAPVPQPLSAARQATPVSRYRFPPSEGVPVHGDANGQAAASSPHRRPEKPERRGDPALAFDDFSGFEGLPADALGPDEAAPPPPQQQRPCTSWTFGAVPWFSKVLEEQCRMLARGELELRKFRKGSVLDQGRRGGPAVGAATGRSSMFSKSTSSLGLGRFASVESAATPSYVAGGDEQQIWKRISSGKLSGPGYRNEAWAPLETKAPTRYARTQPAEQWSGSVPRLPPATKGAKSR
ncbi:serine/threonine kinase [Aureococcus anophagefferens]|nr:serine/threonine kinase [Aureococcus anophagefferens]